MKRKLLSTDPRVVKAIEMYQSGITCKVVCKDLHMNGESLNRFLNEQGLKRTKSEQVRKGKGVAQLKDDAFDILTPEALYWVGFLYADGHIEKEPRCRMSLTLSGKDKTHLEKLNQFLGGNINIREIINKNPGSNPARGQINFDYQYYRLAFSSKKIYSRLIELGFTHNKTYAIIPHDLLKSSRDFHRGLVDGDGWVGFSNETRYNGKYDTGNIGLSGTEDTLKSFLEFVRLSGISTATIPYKDKRANVWKIQIRSNPAQKILNLLYKDSTTYLDRKYQKYLEITAPATILSQEPLLIN